jgi:hypothetical protein
MPGSDGASPKSDPGYWPLSMDLKERRPDYLTPGLLFSVGAPSSQQKSTSAATTEQRTTPTGTCDLPVENHAERCLAKE